VPIPTGHRLKPKYYTAARFDAVQVELAEARKATDAERRRIAETIAKYQQDYPSTLQFIYGTPKYEKPLLDARLEDGSRVAATVIGASARTQIHWTIVSIDTKRSPRGFACAVDVGRIGGQHSKTRAGVGDDVPESG
jgi:hypothetical protein